MLGSNRLALATKAAAWRGVERIKTASISAAQSVGAASAWGTARAREGLAWSGVQLREGARATAAATKSGAAIAAARGKEAGIASGKRAREGAIWAAARAKEGSHWSTQKLNVSARFAWERGVKPAAHRTALGAREAGKRIKAGSLRAAGRAVEMATASAAVSAKLPGVVWRTALLPAGRYAHGRLSAAIGAVADARRRHAALTQTTESAPTEIREPAEKPAEIAPVTREISDAKTDTSVAALAATPAPIEKPEATANDEAASKPKTKRKKKAKHDSIGA
jgi:hypothetical protein